MVSTLAFLQMRWQGTHEHPFSSSAANRLEISKGEYVGKVVTTQREMDTPSSEEDTEYDDILVEATDQTDLPGKCI